MKLNKESRDELRKSVENLLNASPKNKKIQLPKETLDMLLFDTYICNKEKGIKVKLPVWSGEFLQKLDLSQVDFEDVSWCMMYKHNNGNIEEDYLFDEEWEFDKNFCDTIKNLDFAPVKYDFLVDYSNTNAKIDFSKSFDYKYFKYLQIEACLFNNVDLSNNDLKSLGSMAFYYCEFRNTNISLPDEDKLSANCCDFRDNDLSDFTFDGTRAICEGDTFSACIFTNTGVKIDFDKDIFLCELKKDGDDLEQYKSNIVNELRDNIREHWVGCYLNGRKILSTEEKQQSAMELREKYQEFEDNEFSKILDSIGEQIDFPGRKR